MIPLSWITVILGGFVLVFFLYELVIRNKNKKLPASPRGLPLLGHLHLVGKNAHQHLHKLSKRHGPIMHLRYGFVSNIIVSSPRAAEQFVKTHDLVFASRPPLEARVSGKPDRCSICNRLHFCHNIHDCFPFNFDQILH